MKKELIMHSPVIQGYPIHANMNSILPNHPSYHEWLFTNHMQLRFDCYEPDTFHLDFYQPLMREYHPLLNIHSIQKEMLQLLNLNVTDFFIESINNGNYIYVLIDKQYIKAYRTEESAPHDLFIYGYDRDNQEFNIADFFPDPLPTYKKTKGSFYEIEQALNEHINYKEDCWDNVFGIQLISMNSFKSYRFNLEFFKTSLKHYLNSTNSAAYFEAIEGIPAEEQCLHGSLDPVFGIHIYNKLIESVRADHQYIRALHMLSEHKTLMTKRIHYLHKLGLIDGNLFYNLFEDIELKARSLRNNVLKQIITNEHSLTIPKLTSMIEELSNKEYIALDKLASAIG
ncbi:hypothetical protein [Paenibacillus sp. UASWS1643]|uniref:hypothetical protein n=1 Tax=Paenibacillus sp. UASWS1643 TaxID=2580422 RepID=UPI00123871F7|nr:hypothetical protein [Paenibacillus sp. UASWS1643]KAA8747334.1 hypothetical protein FE296_24505 [Paenibacillus sp. UASWS1643]